MNIHPGLTGEVTSSPRGVEILPLSLGPTHSLLEFHYSEHEISFERLNLFAIRTPHGRWYRSGSFFTPTETNRATAATSAPPAIIGAEHELSQEERTQGESLALALTEPIHPIGPAIVEKTSVYLEPDSTISIIATIQNTTGQWLFGRGARSGCEDSLGVRILTARGHLIAEHRIHFHFECLPPGERVELRGSVPWAELSLPPGLYTVALDVVREGVNWSRALISSPQHPLIIPDTIYRATYELSRFHTTKRLTTLTFNAHNDNLYTAELLDILGAMGVKATFFITGNFLRAYPDLVDRMVAQDHEIGNLTDTYQRFAYPGHNLPRQGVTHQVVYDELMRVAEAFQNRYQQQLAPFWRAPYGARNGPLLQYATDVGFRHISWSLDSLDDRSPAHSLHAGVAVHHVEEYLSQPLGRGSILLFNASSNHVRAPLYDSIQRIVEFAWSKGFSFRSCGEMIEETKQHPLVLTYPRD